MSKRELRTRQKQATPWPWHHYPRQIRTLFFQFQYTWISPWVRARKLRDLVKALELYRDSIPT